MSTNQAPVTTGNYYTRPFSLVDTVRDTIPKVCNLESFRNMVTGDTYAQYFTNLRLTKDKAKRNALKSELPAITLSSCMEGGRNIDSIISLTGMIQLDLDIYTEDREKYLKKGNVLDYDRQLADGPAAIARCKELLLTDKSVIAVFLSPSGNGVKAVIAVDYSDLSEHKQAFETMRSHFIDLGIPEAYVDTSTKDPSRLFYISYDKDGYFRDETDVVALPLAVAPVLEKEPATISVTAATIPKVPTTPASRNKPTPADVEQMLKVCPVDDSFGDMSDYDTWLAVGMALKAEGYVFELWDAWSSTGSTYKASEMQTKWDSFSGDLEESGYSIATVIAIAVENGYVLPAALKPDMVKLRKKLVASFFPYQKERGRAFLCIGEQFFVGEDKTYSLLGKKDFPRYVIRFLLNTCPSMATKTHLSDIISHITADKKFPILPAHSAPQIALDGSDASNLFFTADKVIDVSKDVTDKDRVKDYSVFTHFVTQPTDYNWADNTPTPLWDAFLNKVLPTAELQEQLQMMVGACLTHDVLTQNFFVLYGEGDTGKSTVLEVIRELLHTRNTTSLATTELYDKFATIKLTQKKCNLSDEMGTTGQYRSLREFEEYLKKLVSSNTYLNVQRKGAALFEAKVTATLVFATNALHHVADESNGMWRRFTIIPFNEIVTAAEKDTQLVTKLRAELPGILNWAIQGRSLIVNKYKSVFPVSGASKDILDDHKEASNHPLEFLSHNCEVNPGSMMHRVALYDIYRNWATANGYKVQTSRKFTTEAFKYIASKGVKANTDKNAKASIIGHRGRIIEGIHTTVKGDGFGLIKQVIGKK